VPLSELRDASRVLTASTTDEGLDLDGAGEEVSAAARAIAAEAILVRARASSFKTVYLVLVTPPPFLGGPPSSLWQERDSDRRWR